MNEQLQRLETMIASLITIVTETRADLLGQAEEHRAALSAEFAEARAYLATQGEKTRISLTAQTEETKAFLHERLNRLERLAGGAGR